MKNTNLIILLLASACLFSCSKSNNDQQEKKIENTNKYYLPTHITYFNDEEDAIVKEVSYEYDDDLLGYTQTKVLRVLSNCKDVYKYRFSEDFKSYTVWYWDYEVSHGEYYLWYSQKYEVELLNNNSYTIKVYDYIEEDEKFYFNREITKLYNEKGLIILSTVKKPNEDKEGEFYYSSYDEYEYDDEGFPTHFYSYDYDLTVGKNKYLSYYEDYSYNETKTYCKLQTYYRNDPTLEFEKDGYTEMNIVVEDGITKFTMQNYEESGELGNYNVRHLNEDFVEVYSYYGGMGSETKTDFNEYNQIESYWMDEHEFSINVEASYLPNGGKLKTSHIVQDNKDGNMFSCDTEFSYNENNQVCNAEEKIKNGDQSKTEYDFVNTLGIEYSDKQNDLLHETLDYYDEIISGFSIYVLQEKDYIIY